MWSWFGRGEPNKVAMNSGEPENKPRKKPIINCVTKGDWINMNQCWNKKKITLRIELRLWRLTICDIHVNWQVAPFIGLHLLCSIYCNYSVTLETFLQLLKASNLLGFTGHVCLIKISVIIGQAGYGQGGGGGEDSRDWKWRKGF